jgi:hypothetical protein
MSHLNPASLWSVLSVEPDEIQTDDDPEILWQQYFRRQQLLKQVVAGEMHPDDMLDCLLDDGLSPDDYLDSVDNALIGVF